MINSENTLIEKRDRFLVTERRSIYKSDWLELIEDKVINTENNKKAAFGCVYSKPAVCILPIDSGGNIYLNKEFKYAINKKSILTAGGFIENGEDPLTAAKRELKEEMGITANKWLSVGQLNFFGSISNFNYSLFIAEDLKFGNTDWDENESLEIVKMKLDEAYKKVMNNEITYAGAVSLILKTHAIKNNS